MTNPPHDRDRCREIMWSMADTIVAQRRIIESLGDKLQTVAIHLGNLAEKKLTKNDPERTLPPCG
jgi:uncharacterized coiled-coil protein SlyX